MNKENIFLVSDLCREHHVEISFIHELQENGLVELETVEQTEYIPADALGQVERFIRLHSELSINVEGLEAISHLLQKVETLQHQIIDLQNQLRLYEDA